MIGVAEVSFAGAGALAVWFAVWGRGFGNGTVTAKATHGDATIAAARKPRAIRLVMFDDAAKTLPAIRISKPGPSFKLVCNDKIDNTLNGPATR